MRRITEIDLDDLLHVSEKQTADTYVRLFRDAGLYSTIDENMESEGILLIWKLRDVLELLYKAEEKYQASRQPRIFATSSMFTYIFLYLISIVSIITYSWAFLPWIGGSAVLILCAAIIKWIQVRSMEQVSLIRCQLIRRKMKKYLQELSSINFGNAIGSNGFVLHHPQRKKIITELYNESNKIRFFENKLLDLFSKGLIKGTTHTCIGQENNAVGVCAALNKNDIVLSNHRCHGHFISHTKNYSGLLNEILGKSNGVCGGVGGSQHLFYKNILVYY